MVEIKHLKVFKMRKYTIESNHIVSPPRLRYLTYISSCYLPKKCDLRTVFPVPHLTYITSAPTHQNIQMLQTELNSNAIIIHLSKSTFGHMVLTMPQRDYLLKIATSLLVPVNPGIGPSIAQRASKANITQAHHIINVDKNTYDTYHTTNEALKLQLLETVRHIYIEDLNDNDIGFSGIATRQILAHLWVTYGNIYDDMLGANTEQMKTPWVPPTPIEIFSPN